MSQPSNLPYTDPHAVLGVHQGASRDEVKAAFRRAALACHPDVDSSPTAAARFAQVKTAADVLLKGVRALAGPAARCWVACACVHWTQLTLPPLRLLSCAAPTGSVWRLEPCLRRGGSSSRPGGRRRPQQDRSTVGHVAGRLRPCIRLRLGVGGL